MTAALTAASEAETRVFGPRPPIVAAAPPPPVVRSRTLPRRWLLIAVALVAGVGAVALLRPTPAAPSARPAPARVACSAPAAVPTGSVTVTGDVDGNGCADLFVRTGDVIERVGAANGEKFSVGRASDVIVLGDWDCDGRDTPALYRPDAGRTWIFNSWAATSEPVTPARSTAASGPPRTPRCAGPRAHGRA